MDMLDKFILMLNDYLYSYAIIAIILVVGIFFTIRGRGMQFTLSPEMFRVLTDKATIDGKGKKGGFFLPSLYDFRRITYWYW